ncbi:hypothetical protein DYU05_20320 [Mucilaginibacter terrenus]|uniref:DUF479 domain-containing protein n=1 Tax=Mucilaginibacter terrenus TaxID=2482727 RepID=A0A3E2NJD1_9SPHI|nr:hypothetical protein [Mucilaginibacter terrenus]RFZ81108.1 hypothetical protein DYU05_20320 [Mucilaginibacter terrenus]
MNFLSHYYFDRNTTDCYFTLGTVLPDLLKNADKSIVLHPEKLLHADSAVNSMIAGWNKHLLVDKFFHSSEFFLYHSHTLKNLLTPAVAGSPVKPFFLGHIAIELILDNLLLTTGEVEVDDFYAHLDSCHESVIAAFLDFAEMKNSPVFFKFYESFKSSRYLTTYVNLDKVTYALKRICMRVWHDPFTPEHELAMTEVVLAYRESILNSFMSIYAEIDQKMKLV